MGWPAVEGRLDSTRFELVISQARGTPKRFVPFRRLYCLYTSIPLAAHLRSSQSLSMIVSTVTAVSCAVVEANSNHSSDSVYFRSFQHASFCRRSTVLVPKFVSPTSRGKVCKTSKLWPIGQSRISRICIRSKFVSPRFYCSGEKTPVRRSGPPSAGCTLAR